MAAAEARAENPNLEKRKKWGATKPLAPFHFEQREKTRPMSIMQVCDLERRKRERLTSCSAGGTSISLPETVLFRLR